MLCLANAFCIPFVIAVVIRALPQNQPASDSRSLTLESPFLDALTGGNPIALPPSDFAIN
jgi:hypothetical protein